VYGDTFFKDYLGQSRRPSYQENEIDELLSRLKLYIRDQSVKPSQQVMDAIPHPMFIHQSPPLKEQAKVLLSNLGIAIVGNPGPSGLYIAPRTTRRNRPQLATALNGPLGYEISRPRPRPAIIPTAPNYLQYMRPSSSRINNVKPSRSMGGRHHRKSRKSNKNRKNKSKRTTNKKKT
jgi:hypothetical protein